MMPYPPRSTVANLFCVRIANVHSSRRNKTSFGLQHQGSDVVEGPSPDTLDCCAPQVWSKGERLRDGLRHALGSNPHVKEVRGLGLLCGIQLDTVSR